jgi:hypothetical protein
MHMDVDSDNDNDVGIDIITSNSGQKARARTAVHKADAHGGHDVHGIGTWRKKDAAVITRRWGDDDAWSNMNEADRIKIRQQALRDAEASLRRLVTDRQCASLLLKLAWQDACTYTHGSTDWPFCGGVNGSIRLFPEIDYECNQVSLPIMVKPPLMLDNAWPICAFAVHLFFVLL